MMDSPGADAPSEPGALRLVSAALRRLCSRVLLLPWWIGLWRPPDRFLFEDVLLPHDAARALGGRVLFVGVRFYTRHYPRFFAGCERCELTTLDPNPAMRRPAPPGTSRTRSKISRTISGPATSSSSWPTA